MGHFLKKAHGELHAYEPQRIPFYQLCANVLLNQLDNVFPHNIALGSEVSNIQIYDSDVGMWNSGAYSLIKEYRQVEGIDQHLIEKSTTVEIATLDKIEFSQPIHLIKMDVEGYEIHVIEGGENFLRSNGYPYVIFEVWDSTWFLDKKNALLQKFFDLGYEIEKIDSTNFLAQHKHSHAKVKISSDGGIKRASLILR